MSKFYLLIFGFYLLLPLAHADVDPKTQLLEILKNKKFDENAIKGKATSITFNGHNFSLDENGTLYKISGTEKYPVEIYFDESRAPNKEFLIFDPAVPPKAGLEPNPLSTRSATPAQLNVFDDIVSVQRLIGIHTMKTKNPECYLAYAEARLGKDYVERLLALERSDEPRPLAFASDDDWKAFKNDLKSIFAPLASDESYLVLIGTSTTFFSENPKKGQNAPLFAQEPACVIQAKDPVQSRKVYTFDTTDRSDIDVHILIPPLGDLCERAAAPGNNGLRGVYFENTLDKCFIISPDIKLSGLVRKVAGAARTLKPALIADKPLGQFYQKWETEKLAREINLSVTIRPDQRKSPLTGPDTDFRNDPHLKTPFVIPVN